MKRLRPTASILLGMLAAVALQTTAPAAAADSAADTAPTSKAQASPLGNLSPADALKAFETEPGFIVELVAAEPLTIDPVALAFDEAGRLFVAEDRDYPTGSPDGRPLGVIACLEDTDGDGRMDRRTEFARDLKFPNGVMPWRGGVIVTAAPDIWWLADTNADGRADVKELLLTGFDTNTTSQLRANDPTLGLDGWVYVAGGLRGGKVRSPRHPEKVVDTDRGDLRFKPDTGEIETVAGKSQFGLAFDLAGERFACMNRIQSQHAPLASRYAARNPHLVSPGALHDCPSFEENSLMTRYRAGAARYYPISANLTTADSHLGTYSAACAVFIHRGDTLPSEYRGAAFSCDPTGNLVRGDRLEKVGGTFAAVRIHEGTEALRSRDNWFRPVFIADGPDGALYIADMYRKTIEHPEYLPGEVRKHTDFESGKTQGRIWRLKGRSDPVRAPQRLKDASTVDCVEALRSPRPWTRDVAFRLLLEKRDPDATRRLLAGWQIGLPAGPAVAHLRLLQLFSALPPDLLRSALAHPAPEVRRNAVQLAELFFATQRDLRDAVAALARDPDPHVRFQTALSLGETTDLELAVPALAEIASRQGQDRWTRAALLSAVPDRPRQTALLDRLLDRPAAGGLPEDLLAIAADLGQQLGLRDQRERPGDARGFDDLWRRLQTREVAWTIATLAGYSRGIGDAFGPLVRAKAAELGPIFVLARALAARQNLPLPARLRAIEWLTFDESSAGNRQLIALLETAEPKEIQQAAVRALVRPSRLAVLGPLLASERWNVFTPGVRAALLERLAGRAELSGLLLDAVERGAVPAGLLMPQQRDALRKSRDPAIKARAEALFAAPGGSRQKAFAETKAALKLPPRPANGRAVFERACAACHRLNQLGVAVGPDLFDIRQQPKESILYHIVIPEAEIAPTFVNYECELKDGRQLNGLLVAESAGSITLRLAQGAEELVPRERIARLHASALSLMPQELEKAISLQEMADLLAYLRGEQ